jgi:RNA polymerase sigma-70 factor (ECF subfamily)
MRARWAALHSSLRAAVRSLQFDLEFHEAKRHHALLAAFSDPGRVIAYLHRHEGALDEKDRLLALLVHLAQRREHRDLATTLLWLGLWPGLDAVYRRRLKYFSDADELVSELASAFIALVERLNLTNVTRVAATLVRSTERDVMAARKRFWAGAQRIQEGTGQVEAEAAVELTLSTSVLGLPPAVSDEEETSSLREWLRAVVGDDAELLVAVAVLEETQREAGTRLGLSHDAARKRFQRALRRVRPHLVRALSQAAASPRV